MRIPGYFSWLVPFCTTKSPSFHARYHRPHHLCRLNLIPTQQLDDAASERRATASELRTVHRHASYFASRVVNTLCESSSWQHCSHNGADLVTREFRFNENRASCRASWCTDVRNVRSSFMVDDCVEFSSPYRHLSGVPYYPRGMKNVI